MQFHTLENTPIGEITSCMNAAFADYEISIQWTDETLRQKIQVEDINLSCSVGAFDGEELVGFTLFGLDEDNGVKRAWDGGTGVIPTYRGQKLTDKMFGYITPLLKQAGAKLILLEVLENNKAAYNIYERLGFRPTRLLHAYKGGISAEHKQDHHIETPPDYDAEELLRLGDWQPAWQQMNKRIANRGDTVTTICIKAEGNIVAYAHYDKQAKRVHQFAVAKQHRRKGMATALFSHIADNITEPWLLTNIDADAENTNAFLQSIRLEKHISQYEMIKEL